MKAIKCEADHEAALARLEVLMDAHPHPGTPEGDELEVLAILVDAYEKEHFPMDDPIIASLDEFDNIRPMLGGKIVCTSGGFDPLHGGHATCIVDSKKHGDTVVVVVNGDGFLTRKKGRPFMNLAARCAVVACLRNVDYVIPFEGDDQTVCEALRRIRPHVFTKGGDRVDMDSIPEGKLCQEMGIEVVFGVGRAKEWSSSDLLGEWVKWHNSLNKVECRLSGGGGK